MRRWSASRAWARALAISSRAGCQVGRLSRACRRWRSRIGGGMLRLASAPSSSRAWWSGSSMRGSAPVALTATVSSHSMRRVWWSRVTVSWWRRRSSSTVVLRLTWATNAAPARATASASLVWLSRACSSKASARATTSGWVRWMKVAPWAAGCLKSIRTVPLSPSAAKRSFKVWGNSPSGALKWFL